MPFTPAHVAAVLPLRGRVALPFAALAAGSMSPDLPYFLPFGASIPRHVTHSALSIITWDLVLGLAMWITWRMLAPTLHDVAPAPIRNRWRLPTAAQPQWLIVALAVMIGAATHVVWDSFTHAGYWGSSLAPLAASYPSPRGPMAGFRYLQYASGAVGLVIVLWFGYRQPSVRPAPRRQPNTAAITPALIFAAALLGVAVKVTTMHDPGDRRALVFATVTSSISGAAVGLIVACMVHALVERRHRAPTPQREAR